MRQVLAALLLLGGLAIAAPPAEAEDIACGCEMVRLFLPGDCLQSLDCDSNPLRCFSPCALSPRCPGLEAGGDETMKTFKIFYNAAVLGVGPTASAPFHAAKVALVDFIIGTFYNKSTKGIEAVEIHDLDAPGSGFETLAQTVYENPNGKPTLMVNPVLFGYSPAELVSFIGHELVHMEQHKRDSYKDPNPGFVITKKYFYELEAYAWQLNQFPSPSVHPRDLMTCMEPEERRLLEETIACFEWRARYGWRPIFKRWTDKDVWAKAWYARQGPELRWAGPSKAGSPPGERCTPL